jgi:hypothetical protein
VVLPPYPGSFTFDVYDLTSFRMCDESIILVPWWNQVDTVR